MAITRSKRLSVKFNTGKGNGWGFSLSNLAEGVDAAAAKQAMESLVTEGALWADALQSVKSLQLVTRTVENWLES